MSAAPDTTPILVETRGLRRTYPSVVALDDVSIEVPRGTCVGLVGKNGAGKSTLIKALAGAVTPEAGEILVDGEPVEIHTPRTARELGLTFVHQHMVGVPDLSVAENIEMGLGFPRRGGPFVNWRALRERALAALGRLDSSIDPRARLGSLSVADQRIVMIAHALAQDARLLVLDEPTASLTESEIVVLHAVVRNLVADGVTVLYVSHRLDEIFSLCDSVVVMRDGRVVGGAQTTELDRAALVSLITGPLLEEPDEDRPVRTGHPAAGEELLRIEGLANDAVAGASLAVRRGEVLGLAGLVGAGRTELCRLIFGADKAHAGTIFVGGQQRRMRSPRDAIAAGIVLVPEERHTQGVVADFRVRENITLPSLPRFRRTRSLGLSSRRERATARHYIDTLSIRTPSAETTTTTLSGGNQQKVVLAKWLERDADVFILDEPTHGIDVQGKNEIYGLIEGLVARGCGVILVSSEFAELVTLCDRVLVMSDGRIVGELAGDELTEHHIVDACFAARERQVA